MELAERHEDWSTDLLRHMAARVMRRTGGEYNTALGSFNAADGDLRLENVTAGTGGRSYLAFGKVPERVAALCDEVNARRHALLENPDPAQAYNLSFDAHCHMVDIHPWVDGNGRTCRLLMNMLQREFHLIPTAVHKEDRVEYITALEEAHQAGTTTPFRAFMTEAHTQWLEKEIAAYKKDCLE